MASEGKPFKKAPKVIQLSEDNHSPASAKSTPARKTAGSIPVIQGLKLVGSVKEKGFSAEADQGKFKGVSVPDPRVTPFPKARHRSEGPHWAPIKSEPTEVVDGTEDAGAESLAAHARPIERKNKKALDFSNLNKKLAMEKPGREKSVTSEKKQPTPISCNEVGKQEELQGQNRIKCDKSQSVEVVSESSEISFTCEQRKGGSSAGNTEKPGELVPLSRETNFKEDAGHSASMKSDDVVSHLNRLQVSTELDTMKKVIKDHVGRADNYNAERDGLMPMTDMEEIDAENRDVLQAMSADEIEEAQSELLGRLRPETVEMLKRRGIKNVKKGNKEAHELNKSQLFGTEDEKKISNSNQNDCIRAKQSDMQSSFPKRTKNKSNESGEVLSADLLSNEWKIWSDRVEAVRTLRFSLDGNIVELKENATDTRNLSQNGSNSDVYHFSVQNVAERDILRTDGDPAGAGYTIKEAAALVRSMVPGQRAVALQLIGAVLDNALANFQLNDDMHGVNKSVDWQAVWSYALGPEPELVLTLRMALDDSHSTVVVACVKVLQCLLSFIKNEHYINLSETFWAGDKPVFLAPVFRRRSKLEEGFLGGGFWKYSAKPSNMFPFTNKNIEEDNEEEATVADDTNVAGQDVAVGLIRMGILPRIRYILEVDQLAAAEEPCLSVIISLARHSPTAADAILKCPRLLDTVTQRYIIEKTDLKVEPIQVKAVRLLKVLCEANRSNCVYFIESGVFQSAERHLFCHYTQYDWLNMGQEAFKSTCAVLVEELRLWKVCIEYGLCVSCFPDFYPALCFWLSPPSFEKIIGRDIVNEVLDVARESFIVLEALARTLSNLHSVEHGQDDEFSLNGEGIENWSWNQVVPMVKVAIEWLNFRESPFLLKTLWLTDKHDKNTLKQDSYRKSSLGVISAVLHALSSIFEKILPLEDIGFCSSDKEQSSGKWLPEFVPQVGLKVIKSRLLHFSEMKLEKIISLNVENSSFLEYLCFLRKKTDYETSLSSLSCFHGIIRLITLVDNVMNFGQSKNHGVRFPDENISDSEKILKRGLVVSSQNELKCALNMFMDLVSSEWHYVQSSEVNDRGGPAPGIGLGWGATDGGFWSGKVLLAQADATVTATLLELFPVVLEKDVFDLAKLNLQSDVIDAFILNTVKKINAALSIVLISGPKDRLIIEKIFNILLTVPVMEFLSIFVHKFSTKETKKSTSINIGDLDQADYHIFSKVLLLHFKSRWLKKKSENPKNGETKRESKSHSASRNSHKRPPLSTICEESTELGRTPVSVHSLGIEWTHQRLPVPVQWLLSPLSSSILEQPSEFSNNNVLLDNSNSTDRVFNTVRSGLFFLLGLEVILSSFYSFQSSPILCIPLVRKIHILSMVFVDGGDLFLETPVRDFLGALQELYGQALDRQNGANSILMSQRSKSEKPLTPQECKDPVVDQKDGEKSVEGIALSTLNFERDIDDSYQTFIDTLIQHFAATSFGDVVYGRQVTIYLRRDVEASIRLSTWNALASDHILDLLPPLEQCFAHPKGYLFPPEDHEKMIEAYVASWISGDLDKAEARMSVTFSLALHHITSFIFIGDKLSMRKKVARNLLLDSSRKPDHRVKMSQLLQYNALDRFHEHGHFTSCQALSGEEITTRSNFLIESCEGDSLLLAEVQKIQTAA